MFRKRGVGEIERQVTKRERFEDTCFLALIPHPDFLLFCTAVSTAVSTAITTTISTTISTAGVAILNLNVGVFSNPPVQAYVEGLSNIYPSIAGDAPVATTSKTAAVSATITTAIPAVAPSETAAITTTVSTSETATEAIVAVRGGQPEI